MFYGLATNKVRVPGLKFTHTLSDIETLNRKAKDAFYDLTAVSFHAYPYLQDQYALLSSGGSVGEGYGPMIVANREYTIEQIKTKKIAVPGTMTTAYLVLKLFAPDVQNPGEDDVREPFEALNILPGVAWIEPSDVSDTVLFLCSDAAKYITGVALPIDAGNTVKT